MVMLLPGTRANKKTTFSHAKKYSFIVSKKEKNGEEKNPF